MLSTVHKIVYIFGFACPVMLCLKIMLLKTWKLEISWYEEMANPFGKFLQWFEELSYLKNVEYPTFILIYSCNLQNCSLHTFVDGSKDAYVAVENGELQLRIEKRNKTELIFLSAKSRVAPLRGVTIPTMELLAAVIGVRLANTIVEGLDWKDVESYYWTDLTTMLAWMLRDKNWSIFLRNRVKEIRRLNNSSSWKLIPGDKNVSDLPSRGCRGRHLVFLKWWEGSQWMKDTKSFYNIKYSSNHDCN